MGAGSFSLAPAAPTRPILEMGAAAPRPPRPQAPDGLRGGGLERKREGWGERGERRGEGGEERAAAEGGRGPARPWGGWIALRARPQAPDGLVVAVLGSDAVAS
ncbi:hypothetical protein SGFS_071220 [Streptomyces graminofaciens]|uniref:Uncharacterized protein n=1 Tax=Streptomyces graminofaciens TaxID=68212 RepID=A0ABM7FFH1_9ACTN|nr:hypothetical protein SGFS_071220 [Streptomyces graminofaciens]